MKSILLASASVLVLAGAASAEISWSGVATLGYNTDDGPDGPVGNRFTGDDGPPAIDGDDDNEGFYWDLEIDVTLSQTLDNGLTAGATFGFEAVDDDAGGDLGQNIEAKDYVLFVESDTAGLFFGDTAFAAETRWTSAGDMEQDGFSEQDGETVLRGDMMYGGIEASISYVISNYDGDPVSDATSDDLDQLSLGAVGTFGNFTVGMAYQEEANAPASFYFVDDPVDDSNDDGNGDFNTDEIFGIFGSTSFAGADVTLAYATNETDNEDSLGVQVAYPFGPVTATVYYVDESNGDANMGLTVAYEDGPISVTLDYDDDQGVDKVGLEGSYDVGNGLVAYAGYLTEDNTDDRFYVAGALDLGGGASLLVSYAEDDDNVDEDEIGDPEYQRGLTVEAAFEF